MAETILKIDNLKTWFDTSRGVLRAVDGVSFDIRHGETLALLGESGCGKSMTALSIMGLVPDPPGRIVDGSILLGDEDLTTYSEIEMRGVRGNRIAMIFQEPMTSLNPVLTIGEQIKETVRKHKRLKGPALTQRALELLEAVGIPDPPKRIKEYPHQLSGGMKQRVMIAIALSAEPDLLIADEPTTALDVTIQAQVLRLLKDLQKQTGMAILLITHDLGVVYETADRIAVMYAGQIVEQASRKVFFKKPAHPYSRRLFHSLPSLDKRDQVLDTIAGSVPPLTEEFRGCRFVARCDQAWDACAEQPPVYRRPVTGQSVLCHLYNKKIAATRPDQEASAAPAERQQAYQAATGTEEAGDAPLLEVRDLKIHFPIHKGLLKTVRGYVYAVDGVEIEIRPGKTLALVGESGCGKTTVGKGILQLLRDYTQGDIRFGRENLNTLKGEALRRKRAEFQIIFQDPFSSMNPRMMISDIIEEGMLALNTGESPEERARRIEELLLMVGLSADMKHRYPHEFSGGQRQRICIARALAVKPKLIVCDEPTSALDVSVQAQILNLLKSLQLRLGLSYLFITHDISVVSYLADDIAVMYLGRIVEQGPVGDVLGSPKHPYTKALFAAVPEINKELIDEKMMLKGDLPSPIDPPKGCHFHPRCIEAIAKCRELYPPASTGRHRARCHLYS